MENMDQTKLAKRSARAASPDQSAAGGNWTISSRPCSTEGYDHEEHLESMACSSMQYGGQVLSLSIKPSTAWTADDLQRLGTLVQSRNRFVCMQLETMAKEQLEKVAAARLAGNAALLHAARFMFLGTVALQESGAVVAAGLFYPRQCSKDGVEMPHMYVELLCCNKPGCGYGSVLLHHIEQYTSAGCKFISEGFFDCDPAASSTGSTEFAQSSSSLDTGITGSTGFAHSAAAVLPILAGGVVSADPLRGCCTACGSYDSSSSSSSNSSLTNTGSVPCDSATVLQSTASSVPPAAVAAAGSGHPTAFPTALQQEHQLVGIPSAPATPAAAAAALPPCTKQLARRICGIKLLSIASAQAFYAHNGYGTPDVCMEMFKPLPARGTVEKGTAGHASTSSISSMGSVSSSCSTALV